MESAEDDIDDVLALAREMAEALEASDRAIALRQARRRVESDAEAQDIFGRLHQAGVRLQSATEAPSADDLDELERARSEARAHPLLWDLLRRQADYVELVLAIDDVLFREAPRMGQRLGR